MRQRLERVVTVTVAVAVAGGSGPGSPGFGTDGGPVRQPPGSLAAPSLLPGAPGHLSLEGPRLVGGGGFVPRGWGSGPTCLRPHAADAQDPEPGPLSPLLSGTGVGHSGARALSGLWPRNIWCPSSVCTRRPEVHSRDSGQVPGPASQLAPHADPRFPYL